MNLLFSELGGQEVWFRNNLPGQIGMSSSLVMMISVFQYSSIY